MLVDQSTVSTIEYGPSDLLVFLDETGQYPTGLSGVEFSMGGCVVKSSDYAAVSSSWRKLKQEVLKIDAQVPLHAVDVVRNFNSVQFNAVAAWLGEAPLKYIMVTVKREAVFQEPLTPLVCIIESLSNQVSSLVHSSFEADHWILEHSDNLTREIIVQQAIYGRGMPMHSKSVRHHGLLFLKKNQANPGLEIADLIAYAAGRRESGRSKPGGLVYKLLGAAFDNSSRGSWLNQGSSVSASFKPGTDGKLQAYEPAKLDFRYKFPRRDHKEADGSKPIMMITITPRPKE